MPSGVLMGNRCTLTGEISKAIIDTSGEPQEKVVKPSVVPVVVEPDVGKKLTKVIVEAVSSDIDVDIQPEDIREGVEILGVVGTLEQPSGEIEIVENGIHAVSKYASANVNVQPHLATKAITENGTYSASDDGVDGYSSVDVNISTGGEYPIIELIEFRSDYVIKAKLSNAETVPQYCFYNYSSSKGMWIKLQTIEIPECVSRIGYGAFANCVSLENVSLPNSLVYITGFNGCTKLSLTSLPDSVTGIGDSCFEGCTNLALTSLPSGLKAIPARSFKDCTSLNLSAIPEGVTTLGDSAFQGCRSLSLTSLPNSLKTLGQNTFQSCTNLALTSLPDGIVDLGFQWAFNGCANITIKSIPSNVTSIGYQTFKGCTGLTTIEFKGIITEIESGAFSGCANITKFSFPSNDTPPTLKNVDAIPTQAITIEVKSGTLSAWQGATNWSALTNVSWVELSE